MYNFCFYRFFNGCIHINAFNNIIFYLRDILTKFEENDGQWFVDEFVTVPKEFELVYRRFISLTDDLLIELNLSSKLIILEYRIGFSIVYEVPILFMRIQTEDGLMVGHDGFWAVILRLLTHKCNLNEPLPYSAFSQVEHAHLGTPFYQFHPCKTKDLMNEILSMDDYLNGVKSIDYMFLWLSLIAGTLGLTISHKLISSLK